MGRSMWHWHTTPCVCLLPATMFKLADWAAAEEAWGLKRAAEATSLPLVWFAGSGQAQQASPVLSPDLSPDGPFSAGDACGVRACGDWDSQKRRPRRRWCSVVGRARASVLGEVSHRAARSGMDAGGEGEGERRWTSEMLGWYQLAGFASVKKAATCQWGEGEVVVVAFLIWV